MIKGSNMPDLTDKTKMSRILCLTAVFVLLFSQYAFGPTREVRFEKIYKVNLEEVAEGKVYGGGIFMSPQKCDQPLWSHTGRGLSFYLTDVDNKKAIVCSFDSAKGITEVRPVFDDASTTKIEGLKLNQPSEIFHKTKLITWAKNDDDFLIQKGNPGRGEYVTYRGSLRTKESPWRVQGFPDGSITQFLWNERDKELLVSVNGRFHRCLWEDRDRVECSEIFSKDQENASVHFFAASPTDERLVLQKWGKTNEMDLYWAEEINGDLRPLAVWSGSPEIFPSFSPTGKLLGFLSKGSPNRGMTDAANKEREPWKIYVLQWAEDGWHQKSLREATANLPSLLIQEHDESHQLCWAGKESVLFLTDNGHTRDLSIRGFHYTKGDFTIVVPRKISARITPSLKSEGNSEFKDQILAIFDLSIHGRFVAFTAMNHLKKRRLYIGVLPREWDS